MKHAKIIPVANTRHFPKKTPAPEIIWRYPCCVGYPAEKRAIESECEKAQCRQRDGGNDIARFGIAVPIEEIGCIDPVCCGASFAIGGDAGGTVVDDFLDGFFEILFQRFGVGSWLGVIAG